MNCYSTISQKWKRTVYRKYSELKDNTEEALRRKWEDKVRCDVCLCKTRQDEHKSNMSSNGDLQGDPTEAFETKWGLVTQGYKVYKLSMTKTLKQSR